MSKFARAPIARTETMTATQSLPVTTLISAAFATANGQQPAIMERWIAASWNIGGRLPASALMSSVQEVGRIDVLLRCMEDERRDTKGKPMPGDPMAFSTHAELSRIWVALAYEIVRLLRDRKLLPDGEDAVALMDGLEAVRVPLMKHEILKDHKLKEPLAMGPLDAEGTLMPSYTYDPHDRRRAHIMPAGLTLRGSLSWQTFDHRTGGAQWIERRYLSDLMLSIAWRHLADSDTAASGSVGA